MNTITNEFNPPATATVGQKVKAAMTMPTTLLLTVFTAPFGLLTSGLDRLRKAAPQVLKPLIEATMAFFSALTAVIWLPVLLILGKKSDLRGLSIGEIFLAGPMLAFSISRNSLLDAVDVLGRPREHTKTQEEMIILPKAHTETIPQQLQYIPQYSYDNLSLPHPPSKERDLRE